MGEWVGKLMAEHVITIFVPNGQSQFLKELPTQSLASTSVVEDDWDHTLDGKAEDLDALELTPVAGKDPDDISRYIRTDGDGKLIVTILGNEGESGEVVLEDLLTASGLKVINVGDTILFEDMLRELKKQNIHLQSMTDERIIDIDETREYV